MNGLEKAWYNNARWLNMFKPLSFIFKLLSERRKWNYKKGEQAVYQAKVPVIVVGNITVGGTGKTPLVILLAKKLIQAGFTPGIVSRGYRSKAPSYPYVVTPSCAPRVSGDEPLLIAQNCSCPVVIDANRVNAVKVLESEFGCNIIISDDGLQHYAMGRDIEVVMIDGIRGIGNGLLLPAGPLREGVERLQEVDFVISNGKPQFNIAVLNSALTIMNIHNSQLCQLNTGKQEPLDIAGKNKRKVHAVAGIGNPERFFNSLCASGFDIISHVFPDHHEFSARDIRFDDDLDVVMTEKDAIKCMTIANDKHWYLKIEAQLDESFFEALYSKINDIKPTIESV